MKLSTHFSTTFWLMIDGTIKISEMPVAFIPQIAFVH